MSPSCTPTTRSAPFSPSPQIRQALPGEGDLVPHRRRPGGGPGAHRRQRTEHRYAVPSPDTSSTPPRGVGALYIRRGVRIPNLLDGGAQERGRRGGTENVAQIVGLAAAMKAACATIQERRGKARRHAGQAHRRHFADRPVPVKRRPEAAPSRQRELLLPGGGGARACCSCWT